MENHDGANTEMKPNINIEEVEQIALEIAIQHPCATPQQIQEMVKQVVRERIKTDDDNALVTH